LLGDLIADNCTWVSPGRKDILRWAGTFKGKQEIANFFAQVEWTLELTEFTPREIIEQGDIVVVLGTLAGRAKTTAKPIKNEWAHVFKFSQGKVVFFQEYIDTAADVLACRKGLCRKQRDGLEAAFQVRLKRYADNSSSNAFASFRSRVLNPSVNHP
jgi:ketosteroid isomerase-like protein